MSKDYRDRRRGRRDRYLDELTPEQREAQRRKFVWEEGDVVITRRGDDKRPKGDEGKSPGR